jgi:hypothetical protein
VLQNANTLARAMRVGVPRASHGTDALEPTAYLAHHDTAAARINRPPATRFGYPARPRFARVDVATSVGDDDHSVQVEIRGSSRMRRHASLASCWLAGCCNAVCLSSLSLHTPTFATPSGLSGLSITFCIDGTCGSGTFGNYPDSNEVRIRDSRSNAFAVARLNCNPQGPCSVDLFTSPKSGHGDAIQVAVSDANGDILFADSRTVSYQTVTSCGQSCDEADVDL